LAQGHFIFGPLDKNEVTLDRSAETIKGHWWFLLSNINGYLSFYRMDVNSFRSESTTKHLSIQSFLVRENTWMLEDLLERIFIVVQQLSVYFERGVFSTLDSPFPWL
jgi:hypothetical protein